MNDPNSHPDRATRTEIDRHQEAIRQAKAATLQGIEQQKEQARQALEISKKAVAQHLAAERQARSPAPEIPTPSPEGTTVPEEVRSAVPARIRALQAEWLHELKKTRDAFDREVRQVQREMAATESEVRAEAIAQEETLEKAEAETLAEVEAETVAAYEGVLAARQQVADLQGEMDRAIAQIRGEVAGAIESLHGEG